MTKTATVAKPSNYSDAQEAIILAAIRENGNVASLALAETLAGRDDMLDNAGEVRKPRALTAKMSVMARDSALGITYARKAVVTKDGKPVTKKTDLVARIAARAGVAAEKFGGLENAPKSVLEILASVEFDADESEVG